MHTSPRLAAQLDWYSTGEFCPDLWQGEQKLEYNDEAAKILRQWDNQPR